MTEADIQAAIMLDLGRGATRVFRNHVAKGFTGEFIRTEAGFTVLKNARRASFGLCVGSSDVIGFRQVVITPDMVGKTVAAFIAIEVKAAGGRSSSEQRAFIQVVRQAGGLAGIARSVDEARAIVDRLV
jgi:VRR-NUC domain